MIARTGSYSRYVNGTPVWTPIPSPPMVSFVVHDETHAWTQEKWDEIWKGVDRR